MANKLIIEKERQDVLNIVLNKLTPSWKESFDKATIEKAQVAKSPSRNYMFGVIMNEKFIKLTKSVAGFKTGEVVSISDIYEDKTASNIAGLIIYRLANSGFKKPIIVEA